MISSLNENKNASFTDQQFMMDFYELHKTYLLYTARKFTQSQPDCEDIVQDVLLRLMKNISTLRRLNQNQTATYLFLTVRSVYADRMRSTQERTITLSNASLEALNHEQDNNITEEGYNAKWDAAILKDALSPRDWTLLEAKYILGYSDSDIAQNLGCAPDSVRTLLRRARNRAKSILNSKQHESEVDTHD